MDSGQSQGPGKHLPGPWFICWIRSSIPVTVMVGAVALALVMTAAAFVAFLVAALVAFAVMMSALVTLAVMVTAFVALAVMAVVVAAGVGVIG